MSPNSLGFRTRDINPQATEVGRQFQAAGSGRNSMFIQVQKLVWCAIAGITRDMALLIPLLLLTAVPGSRAQNPPQASDQNVEKGFNTPKDRVAALQSASIFAPKPVGDADVMQGPEQNPKQFQFHPNDKVYCDFDKPGSQMGGKTPKFSCKITKVESADGKVQVLTEEMKEEPVKIKYGSGDNEIYAEIASTRLMWALGFYADAWYPVRVECNNCPADPESGSGSKQMRSYDAASTVRKYPGKKMYEEGKSDQGWSWKDLEVANGRPNSEKDGLKLLAAFIQHSDNKPPQQRLVCKGVKLDQSTHPFTVTCQESKMIVQDVGASFGGGGLFTSNDSAKMNLQEWSGKKLWKKTGNAGMSEADCPVCQAQLGKSLSAKGGLGDPTISEEGRRFLAALMCQLTDAQIEDLFKAARVASMPKYHESDGSFKKGLDEATIERQWVEAFKAKREQLASGRCRWKNKPTNLATIDNPMGLATVPNHCTAPTS